MRSLFTFPNPVNETSARTVAAGVLLQCVAFVIFRQWWQLIPLTYGFLARVLTGPTLSPLGQLATRVITPRLASRSSAEPRLVPGPPKRFAQAIGLICTAVASTSWALGNHPLAIVFVLFIVVAATLESVFAYCLGCVIFNRLMRWGIIPPEVCESCNDLSQHLLTPSART
ncbi:MAG TPA: DUF4395 domain-containing protein [Ilumatobacteraceae bacterium]